MSVCCVDPKRTLVIEHAGMIGSHSIEPRCTCVAGQYHCENSGSLAATRKTIESLTASPMVSYGGAYSADTVSIPGNLMTPEALEKDRMTVEANKNSRAKCEAKSNPDFENLMKQPR